MGSLRPKQYNSAIVSLPFNLFLLFLPKDYFYLIFRPQNSYL